MNRTGSDGPAVPRVRGVIFDLDGTLVDSRLDFAAMRREMELPAGIPILEAIRDMPPGPRRTLCCQILDRHEAEAIHRAVLIPGADRLAAALRQLNLPHAILTRNAREPARAMLSALRLTSFQPVMAREDAPAKPHPAGILKICGIWGVCPSEVVMVGDFRFDIEAGRNAGTHTILLAKEDRPEFADLADFVISSLDEVIPWITGSSNPN